MRLKRQVHFSHFPNNLHNSRHPLKAARLEFALAVSRNPGPGLKRKAAMAQLLEEWDRTESAKVAKYDLSVFLMFPQLTGLKGYLHYRTLEHWQRSR